MSFENPRPLVGLTIDLAHERDFRLGGLTVSPSSREMTRRGEHLAIEPRVMQVLVALHQADGKVISREDLMTRCWEGRVVGEDSLNRAIWRLRKLAGEQGGAHFAIETIPRVGYRLRAGASKPPQTRRRAPLRQWLWGLLNAVRRPRDPAHD